MSDWRVVFKLRDIPTAGSRLVATPMGDIAVHRTEDDRVFAIADDGLRAAAQPAPEHANSRRFDVHVADGVILLNLAGMGFEPQMS